MAGESASAGGKRALRIGKYEVVSHIATGGMGYVYKARDVESNRLVALKILSAEMAGKPNMVERFHREAKTAGMLRHENIVAIYECAEFNGNHYIAMEFVEGKDLYDHIARKGKLDPEEARQITVQMAKALDQAHRAGIVHRDVKPPNILLTTHGGKLVAKLTDLGLARAVNDEEFRVTRIGTTVGTVDYMAPEQARDSSAADIRSDIYALGCTLYHMLAGHCPFPAGSLPERIHSHMATEPADIRKLSPKTPAFLSAALQKMLAKKQEDRYQSPLALLRDLETPEKVEEYLRECERVATAPEPAETDVPREATGSSHDADDPTSLMRELAADEGQAPDEEPVLVLRGGRKRLRDEDDEDDEDDDAHLPQVKSRKKKRKGPLLPPWWPFALGAAAACILGVVVWLQVTPNREPAKKFVTGDEKPEPPKVSDEKPKPVEEKKKPEPEKKKKIEPVEVVPIPPKKEDGKPVFVGPPAPVHPVLYQPEPPLDVKGLERDIVGPFAKLAAAPGRTVRVGRLIPPGPDAFRTLAEAIAQTEGPLTIEIHDHGPLFGASLAPVKGRDLTLRSAPGVRPLLVWDVASSPAAEAAPSAAAEPKGKAAWLTMLGGTLSLQGLDCVVRWTNGADAPAVWFRLRGGGFHAHDCTFTTAGVNPSGIVVARLEPLTDIPPPLGLPPLPGEGIDLDDPEAMVRLSGVPVLFRRCFARGKDVILLAASGQAVDALIDNTLVATGDLPMLQLAGRDDHLHTLRLVRSTLVASQNLIRWEPLKGKQANPKIRCVAWDCVLARGQATSVVGDLLQVEGGRLDQVRWRPINTVYAGWKRMLQASDRTIPGGSLAQWRSMWKYRDGDREQLETWPPSWPGSSDALPAAVYEPLDTPTCFAATRGPGMIGCEIGRLPSTPRHWLERTYDRFAVAQLPLPEGDERPAIPMAEDGFYHGERIDAAATDVGQLLQTRLKEKKPGPHVVLHLTGQGRQLTSPIQAKGVKRLSLYFEPSVKEEPLSLAVNPRTSQGGVAVLETEGCDLELVNARLLLENRRVAVVPVHLLKMRGGSLLLNRCLLQGSLDNAPDTYQGMIRWQAVPGAAAPSFAAQDSVLLSSKSVLDVRGMQGLSVRFKNVVLVAADDGLVLAPSVDCRQDIDLRLENNTLAFRKRCIALDVKGDPSLLPRPIFIHATGNHFLDPFAQEPRSSHLLHMPETLLHSGQVVWHGKGNAFGYQRLGALLAGTTVDNVRATFPEWQHTWGSVNEQGALQVDAPKLAKAFVLDPPAWQHLVVSPASRPAAGNVGADLIKLGLVKKK